MWKELSAALLTAAALACGAGAEPERVQPPAHIQRTIAVNETRVFEVSLEKGWYVEANVSAPTTLVDAHLIDPSGVDIATSSVRVLAIAQTTGSYRIQVQCPASAVAGGPYSLNIRVSSAPSEQEATLDAGIRARMRGETEKKTSADAAEKSFTTALKISESAGDAIGARESLRSLGLLAYRTGNATKARQWFERELSSATKDGDRVSEARSAFMLGYIYLEADPAKARSYFEQSANVERLLGNMPRVALALNAVAAEYMPGDIDRGLVALKEAKEIATRFHDNWLLADIFTTEGNAYTFRGEFRPALESYEAALPLHRQSGKASGEATALSNMGEALTNIGEYKRAQDAFDDSIAIWKKLGNRVREAYAVHNRARVYAAEGRTELARKDFRSVISTARELNVPEAEAAAWNELGETFVAEKQPAKAIECFRDAIAAVSKGGSARVRGHAFLLRSRAEQELKQHDAAADDALTALRLFDDIADRNNELLAYEAVARAEYGRRKVEAAREYMRKAMDLIESGRAELERKGLQSTYVASRSSFTEFYIRTLVETGRATDAFNAAERFRARNLLDSLGDSRDDLIAAGDPQWAAEDRELRRKLRADAAVVSQVAAAERPAVQRRIDDSLAELDRLAAKRRAGATRTERVTSADPLTAADVQQRAFDEQTALVEFFLGSPRSYAWVVDRSRLTLVELPPKETIEAAAQQLRRSILSFTDDRTSQSMEERKARRAAAAAQAAENALALDRLTVGKLGPLSSKRHLVIVPDGALWYTPWSLLRSISGHDVVVIPSASILVRIRESTHPPLDTKVAVIADPVYSVDDLRVSAHQTAGSLRPASLRMPREETPLPRFSRLRFSREEAIAIAGIVPRGNLLQALDFAASRDLAMSATLSTYRIVHFAAHTLLNNEHPQLSGIVLSLVNREQEPQDGFLRLFDIYGLRLNADLVVLSGCETALGKELRGEGMIGLTQGFLAAGADHVIATLWPVEDRATAEFMKRLYRFLLIRRMRPAAAVTAAKQSMQSDAVYSAPYYWAGFQLIGDWR